MCQIYLLFPTIVRVLLLSDTKFSKSNVRLILNQPNKYKAEWIQLLQPIKGFPRFSHFNCGKISGWRMYVDSTKIDVKSGAFKSRRFQLQPQNEWRKYHPDFCGIVRPKPVINTTKFVYDSSELFY